ncbi:MAG: adenylyltransferase/cytidyltransferase family protein [Simkaniaceae bacterium]|nr:adenylyltransferase/cytidyltransferase family protein [Simkaniaceae bacterium]
MNIYEEKLIDPEGVEKRVKELKAAGKSIVTLNGSFDLMHAGHLRIIHEASKQGDVLLVALNSDASIKKYKSPKRPIIPLEYRLEMMAALKDVDYVTWFEETDPIAFLTKVQPDVHVNGSEYGADCIEAPIVLAGGGRVHVAPLKPGLSTTNIIAKVKCDI